MGARHHGDGIIDRVSSVRLRGIVNADQRNTDHERRPNRITVGDERGAVTTCHQDNRAASTSHNRTSRARTAAPDDRTTTSHNKRLLPAQQRRHVLPAR